MNQGHLRFLNSFNAATLLVISFVILMLGCKVTQSQVPLSTSFAQVETFQLLPPKVVTDSILFRESAEVDLQMDFPETEIRYTLDGTVVKRNSILYNNTLTINKTTLLQAVSFHPDCQESEVLVQPFFKTQDVFSGAKLLLHPSADARYAANGVASLTDSQKGAAAFRSNNHWLGFQKDTVDIAIDFTKKTTVESITVSTLADENAWIFLPGRIELLEDGRPFAFVEKETLAHPSKTGLHFITIDFPKRDLQKTTIRVLSDPLPEGHNGFGYTAWFFIDEIFVID